MSSRDRLAERRAQQQGPGVAYPLSSVRAWNNNPYNQRDDYDEEKFSSSANFDLGSSKLGFYDQLEQVRTEISKYEGLVDRIGALHENSLEMPGDDKLRQLKEELEDKRADATASSAVIKRRIAELQNWKGPDKQPKQVALLKDKFIKAIENYQSVERDFRKGFQLRQERQARIINPTARPDEIKAMVQGDDESLFTQALQNSNRVGDANAAYREVEARRDDIIKIEKTLTELAQLFNDMSMLVQQQDETIDTIQVNARAADDNIEAGLKQTTTAVTHARSARKLRKWCLVATVVIIIIIVIIVLVTVLPKINNKN